MPGFKSNDIYQNRPKIIIANKIANSSSAGAFAPRPPSTALPLQISGFAPG